MIREKNIEKNEEFKKFVDRRTFTKTSISRFAKYVGIDPGIVVGRLQKEEYISYAWHNDLKTQYVIS